MINKKKYLIVKGCAGLGNRLITLSNAIEYAKETNRIIYVDWCDGQFAPLGENAFYKYFRLENIVHINTIKDIQSKAKANVYPTLYRNENLHKSLYELYDPGRSVKFGYLSRFLPERSKITKLIEHWDPITNNEKLKSQYPDFYAVLTLFKKNHFPFGGHLPFNLKEDIVIFADYIPSFSKDAFLNHVRLNTYSKNLISEIHAELFKNNKIIGVHIRCSDKKPNHDFHMLHEKLKEIGKEEHLIFLSTDNIEIEKQFKLQYSNLISTNKFLPPLIGQGLHQYAKASKNSETINTLFQESLIDMWLLSKCDYLVAQKGSSFSYISSILKDKPTKTLFW